MRAFKEKLQKALAWSRNAPELSRKAVIIGLFLCVLAGFGLRALRLYAEPVLSVDGQKYVQMAEEMQKSVQPAPARLSPHRIYAAYLATRPFGLSPHQAGRATNMLLGSLLALLFFGIAKVLFGSDELALACALLGAIHPNLVAYSIEVQREIPCLFFGGLFFLFLALLYRTPRWYWNPGLAFGAVWSSCARYESLELFLFALLFYVVTFIKKKDARRKTLGYCALFAICSALFFVLLLLWLRLSPAGLLEQALQKIPFFRSR